MCHRQRMRPGRGLRRGKSVVHRPILWPPPGRSTDDHADRPAETTPRVNPTRSPREQPTESTARVRPREPRPGRPPTRARSAPHDRARPIPGIHHASAGPLRSGFDADQDQAAALRRHTRVRRHDVRRDLPPRRRQAALRDGRGGRRRCEPGDVRRRRTRQGGHSPGRRRSGATAYEEALFPRSEAFYADTHEILDLCLGERAPVGFVDLLNGASQGWHPAAAAVGDGAEPSDGDADPLSRTPRGGTRCAGR